MASPTPCEYETVARGYKVVYNAPQDFFSYKHCSSCAEGGDAVLMEEGECPRCGCLSSYKPYECCESCDREWAALVYGQCPCIRGERCEKCYTEEDAYTEADKRRLQLAEYRQELQGKTLAELQECLAKVDADLPDLEKDLSELGVETYEDALLWKGIYEQTICEHEAALAELKKAKANYHSALMSDPSRPGYDRCCSNFEDDVEDAERYLASL